MLAQNYDWYPATEAKSPIIVFVHGSAWVSGDKSDNKTLAEDLVTHKLCVAILHYSLAPQTKHPVPFQQLQSAL